MMFTKKSDGFNGFGTSYGSRMKSPNFSTTKFVHSRNVDNKSSVRSRVMQKIFSNADLSLNALTKELEARKKNIPCEIKNQHQLSTSQDGIFLSEINENCQQDMKFIN